MREPLVRKREYKPKFVIRASEVTVMEDGTIRLMEAFDRAVPKARQLALDTDMTALLNPGEEHVEIKGITLRKLE